MTHRPRSFLGARYAPTALMKSVNPRARRGIRERVAREFVDRGSHERFDGRRSRIIPSCIIYPVRNVRVEFSVAVADSAKIESPGYIPVAARGTV